MSFPCANTSCQHKVPINLTVISTDCPWCGEKQPMQTIANQPARQTNINIVININNGENENDNPTYPNGHSYLNGANPNQGRNPIHDSHTCVPTYQHGCFSIPQAQLVLVPVCYPQAPDPHIVLRGLGSFNHSVYPSTR